MSDSDIEVHAFDQTNDMIPATGSEQDGALSGTTTADIEDPTGSRVAAASRGADDTSVTSGSEDDGADDTAHEDAGAAATTVAAPAAADAGGLAASEDEDVAAADAGRAEAPREAAAPTDTTMITQEREVTTGVDDGAAAADRGAERDARPEPATLTEESGDEAGEDYAPTADLPLPGTAADDADRGEEHTYVVDEEGTATDAGASEATYSGAPEVAAWSAGDDGRDEGSTRAESSASPTDDASHTGRLADAYEAGPADEVGGTDRPGSLQELVGDDDGAGHVFDQTNGVVDGIEGESDGTAAADTRSAGER